MTLRTLFSRSRNALQSVSPLVSVFAVLAASSAFPLFADSYEGSAQEPAKASQSAEKKVSDKPAKKKKPLFSSNTFGGLRARAIGPAIMSGRVSSIDAVAVDPLTIYVGAASGGLWKSTDAGTTFKPIFDDYPQSVGVVRLAPSDPNTVWVGTGEPWPRNSVSYGLGVYKSTDAGENWKAMGLEETERISAIRIHPEDPNVVYVCATGPLFHDHEARGLFKTADGGDTWEKILYVDEKTGCADMDIDPQEPEILYAAMWQFRRSAHFFESGGPGSGLYRSTDGGESWEEVREGLPKGDLGRIAVAIAPSRPNVVYATVEAEHTALYRSDDLGRSWQEVNASQNVQMRPFYFSELVVDPTDHNRVYKPGFMLTISVDGGKSFSSLFGSGFGSSVHPDHHALWINPHNPHEILLGTDGGVYLSQDRATRWNHLKTLPLSQPYHVNVDNETPYNVYGGLQDNGSWTGPSRATGGIVGGAWQMLSFGDGFWVVPDPEDANTVYSEIQGGRLLRVDKKLGTAKSIFPYPNDGQEKLRFNWNSPIYVSPNDPATLYFGSQYLHRSKDRGESWQTISPDLTTDDPAKQRQAESGGLTTDNSTAENHCTIYTISESPKNPDLIWVGTDDGNLQISRDAGATWTNVAGNVSGIPEGAWVSEIHASPHDEATAFATFDGHWTGDFNPYVYRTSDYGQNWTALGLESLEGYAHVIKQDPVNPNLLFVGTELGLWISLDGGGQWARFKENLPLVPVHDLTVQERESDLVLATHGRGFYILDDLTPLRALTLDALKEKVVLLPSKPAEMYVSGSAFPFSIGADDEFVGESLSETASIVYYLSKRHLFGDLKVEIFDASGKQITTLQGGKRKGINRVSWPMRYKAPKLPAATNLVPAFSGPRVPEGTYTVKLTKGKQVLEGEVQLVPDQRSPYPEADRKLQQKSALEVYDALEQLTYLTTSLTTIRDQAKERAEASKRSGDRKKLEELSKDAEEMRASLVSTNKAGWLSGDEKLRENLGALYGNISTYDGRPTGSQMDEKDRLFAQLEEAKRDVDGFVQGRLAAANQLLTKRGAETIELMPEDQWMAENSGTGASAAVMLSSKRNRQMLRQMVFRGFAGL